MRSSTVLRFCVVLEWVFCVVGVGVSFAMERFLPEPLQAWLRAEAEGDPTIADVALIALFVLLLVAAIVSAVGLLLLQRWAAWLYLVNSILFMLLMPFMGPTVEHPLEATMYEVGSVLGGMVIALAFFSDALRKHPAELSTPRDAPEAATPVS